MSKLHRDIEELRGGTQSPRPETPEPDSRQGRRNPPEAGVQLLDDDDAVSVQVSTHAFCTRNAEEVTFGAQLELCLKHIFAKYCTPKLSVEKQRGELLEPPTNAWLSQEGLDAWARDTNGAPFDEATKEELLEFMDVTEDGNLTSVVFRLILEFSWPELSVYQVQRFHASLSTSDGE